MSGLVLIVEDEPVLGRNMRTFLERRGYEAVHVDTIALGLQKIDELQPDIMLIDHNLPDGTGLSLIEEVRRKDRWTKLVMITAHGGVDLAVAAMKAGADDYLTKPVSLDEIALLVDRLLAQARKDVSLSFIQSRDQQRNDIDRIIGVSPPIAELKKRIRFLTTAERSSQSGENQPGPPVLILGETGTGKELVARALHSCGPRASEPFISVNCATLPEQLVESELFGHERGAFSGATEKKIGLFQAADGGTLFLDELGELPLAQQGKLLKAIENMTIRPVGSVRDRKINVRFVAATNAAIEERSRSQEFRSDLLYRLNTITLDVPPLRKRGQDILLIAESFVAEFQRRYGRSKLSLTEGAKTALMRHPWPGNIRQLRNVIEQACLMCARDEIDEKELNLRDLPGIATQEPETVIAPKDGLAGVERTLIIGALRQFNGNVTLASRKLGISRDTLRYRMEKFELNRNDYT